LRLKKNIWQTTNCKIVGVLREPRRRSGHAVVLKEAGISLNEQL